jgi:hypothetical protein
MTAEPSNYLVMRSRALSTIIIGLMPLAGIAGPLNSQQPDATSVIRDLEAANVSRHNNLVEYTNIERYAVYRGNDQTHPAAEMTVRVTYKKGTGKSYTILEQSGSGVVLKYGLHPLLENEKAISDPARVAQSWFTTANYDMKLKPGVTRVIDGRKCLAVAISPHRKAPNLVEGTLWVDANDHTLVEVEGFASKKPFVFAGTTKMMRRYIKMTGYAMATHAHAESSSFLFGHTAVNIEYSDYHLQLRPSTPAPEPRSESVPRSVAGRSPHPRSSESAAALPCRSVLQSAAGSGTHPPCP